ncbi:hypothetical protein BCV69DRAFT_103031 [Microstroma glucosiphilum]|uniref:Mitochondrial import inner membrane translocase subunit TIM16 n=1 Tax=Pseudomicrostroma glucosiphilum TaxID=1684307 RepID=A0A316UCJ6_9BASI|nr:hypothetical protein BCV69DRAFT_103031 [Pseudomicrostroma glucosiphilum]PWN22957.1 hypothetical protein BCV69DRAFT_103031 [Pseudomicrostroma glucosiphilum]
MSLPQLLARVVFQGTQIVGKAFAEAGRQAWRNARTVPAEASAAGGAGAGGANSASGNSKGDQLTRTHRMTVEEARMILNLKAQEGEVVEEAKARLTKSYDHLFAVNAPPAPKGQKGGGSGSFYMQSKVVRARQRIEAEWEEQLQAVKEAAKPDAGADQSQTPPPPPPPAQ